MYSTRKSFQFCFAFILLVIAECTLDPSPHFLLLYSPGELEFTDVIVKRVHDNLTLVCERRSLADLKPHRYVWNFLPLADGQGVEHEPLQISPVGLSLSSELSKTDLQLSDSGQYICSAPPFSVTKNILVQTRGPAQCAHGAFWCGARCVLAAYVCDGRADCEKGEDEATTLCGQSPCNGPDKLNCTEGRCISSSACCSPSDNLCRQPRCCDLHPQYYRDGIDNEYPALFEDRHAPDDYGFIQSTIYTVTACALIFMIAVVLLVSAICKMHMKRAALRGHARAYQVQAHRFPPCYEASRLLDREGRVSVNNSPVHTPGSPAHTQQSLSSPCGDQTSVAPESGGDSFALGRLGALFSSRYRQVPTHPPDVELQNVHSASLNSSPTRNRTQSRLEHYRSPTFTDFDYYPNSENESFGRDLNYMATPVEFFRRRTVNRGLDRILDQFERPRPLTLQLGRFQLSIPRFGRRSSTDLDRRPDTPNIAEINIDDLDFVRLNGNDTYTLNGRTIRLLGANFENYPSVGTSRPPPYNEAMRYKLYGPPPEYLSRDTLTNDRQAQNNVEMPPRYEEVGTGSNGTESAEACNTSNVHDDANGTIELGNASNLNEATGYASNVNDCSQINSNACHSGDVNGYNANNVTENAISLNQVNGNDDSASYVNENANSLINVNNNAVISNEASSYNANNVNGNACNSGDITGYSANNVTDNANAVNHVNGNASCSSDASSIVGYTNDSKDIGNSNYCNKGTSDPKSMLHESSTDDKCNKNAAYNLGSTINVGENNACGTDVIVRDLNKTTTENLNGVTSDDNCNRNVTQSVMITNNDNVIVDNRVNSNSLVLDTGASCHNGNIVSLSDIIDNLPAIDDNDNITV